MLATNDLKVGQGATLAIRGEAPKYNTRQLMVIVTTGVPRERLLGEDGPGVLFLCSEQSRTE